MTPQRPTSAATEPHAAGTAAEGAPATMLLTYKYRLNPEKRQHRALERILEQQRQIYNAALEERILGKYALDIDGKRSDLSPRQAGDGASSEMGARHV